MIDLARRPATTAPRRLPGSYERGTALVFSLVILVVLTILGISAMRTSALEQIMAGNMQESTRALQAADSGMASALDAMLTNRTHPSNFASASYTFGTAASATANVPAQRQIGKTQARDDPPSSQEFCFAFFNQAITATGRLNATARLGQGLRTPAVGDPNSETPCS